MTRLLTCLIALVALIALPHAALAEKRVALVIGNGAYETVVPLDNPRNDASAMAAKLRGLGFETVEGYDLDVFSMQMKIREFGRLARDADVSLFFYAGHGLGVDGTNYVVPIDARFEDPTALEFEAVKVDTVLAQMQLSKGVSLVFLDACRDNPMADTLARSLRGTTRSASVQMGLAAVDIVEPGRGTAIAFATSPGDTAADGEGMHSPFTEALLRHIDRPNTGISEVMSYVTGDVRKSTSDRQTPWLNASLTGPVVLNPVATPVMPKAAPRPGAAPGAVTEAPAEAPSLEVQKALYDVALQTDRAEDYEAYLTLFPDGLFSLNARSAIARLRAADTPPVRTATPEAPFADVEEPTGPLVLTVTPRIAALAASAETEALLDMDRAKRREVQARLNLSGVSGVNAGHPDGAFGPNTRRAISAWQAGQGLTPSGYLNAPQLEILMTSTETQFAAWAAANPTPAPSTRVTTRTGTAQPSQRTTIDPVAGAILGIGLGILGQAIRR